jgi:outer membrane protein TolC
MNTNHLGLIAGAVLLGALGASGPAIAADAAPLLTLEGAVERALGRTSRARLIRGDEEIAKETYHAKRLNFYLPTISINGATPSYETDQSYRFFGGSSRKQLYKTTDFGVTSFIKLEQDLVTGGALTMTANLASTQNKYPDTSPSAIAGTFLDERSRRGFFDFILEQPILRPSAARHDLHTAGSDKELAALTRADEEARLETEVKGAYLDVLLAEVDERWRATLHEQAEQQAEIDSTKWQDGVISKDAWLASALERLDAELAHRASEGTLAEKRRQLALLVDADPSTIFELQEPGTGAPIDPAQFEAWTAGWERASNVRRAEIDAEKARRNASYAAAGRGLTGDLRASYSSGQGEVRLEGQPDESIDTEGWAVALNVSYPLWDGGASGAASRAEAISAARADLELSRARQEARSTILRLVNEVSVGYRRLEIHRTQIELAGEGVAIAESRRAEGRLSDIGYLEAEAKLLETRSTYLTELKTYLANRGTLEGQFSETGTH